MNSAKVCLTLFITGETSRSLQAIAAIERICKKELVENYELQVVDVLKLPDIAEEWHVLATPTLIKKSPLPIKRVIGELGDSDLVVRSLDLAVGKIEDQGK